jgi:hypothetical protein
LSRRKINRYLQLLDWKCRKNRLKDKFLYYGNSQNGWIKFWRSIAKSKDKNVGHRVWVDNRMDNFYENLKRIRFLNYMQSSKNHKRGQNDLIGLICFKRSSSFKKNILKLRKILKYFRKHFLAAWFPNFQIKRHSLLLQHLLLVFDRLELTTYHQDIQGTHSFWN